MHEVSHSHERRTCIARLATIEARLGVLEAQAELTVALLDAIREQLTQTDHRIAESLRLR